MALLGDLVTQVYPAVFHLFEEPAPWIEDRTQCLKMWHVLSKNPGIPTFHPDTSRRWFFVFRYRLRRSRTPDARSTLRLVEIKRSDRRKDVFVDLRHTIADRAVGRRAERRVEGIHGTSSFTAAMRPCGSLELALTPLLMRTITEHRTMGVRICGTLVFYVGSMVREIQCVKTIGCRAHHSHGGIIPCC